MLKLALPFLALLPAAATAQTLVDVGNLVSMEDIDVVTVGGENLGEIEAVLVDQTGTPMAVAVEVGGFLGIGDSDRVISLDRLSWGDGAYTVDITEDEVEQLPEWED